MTSEFGQFHRIELMLGSNAFEKLQQSYVVIAGLGAVGGFTLETLARSGIGRFLLIDCDTITPSNINRQILATWETVGTKKTQAAQQRVWAINPHCRVETLDLLINSETVEGIFAPFAKDRPDFLVDAIDSLAPKVELIASTLQNRIPFCSSMGAALRTDPDLIRVGSLTDVTYCPLSALLRKRLRRRGINTDDIFCVYSPEEVRVQHHDKILDPIFSEDDKRLHGRRRSTLGSLPTITSIFGLRIAHEAIRFLTRPEESCDAGPKGK